MEDREPTWVGFFERFWGKGRTQELNRYLQGLGPAVKPAVDQLERLGRMIGSAAEEVERGKGKLNSRPHLVAALWGLEWGRDLDIAEVKAYRDAACDWFLGRLSEGGNPPVNWRSSSSALRAKWRALSHSEKRDRLHTCMTAGQMLAPQEIFSDPVEAVYKLREALNDNLPPGLGLDPPPLHQLQGKPVEHLSHEDLPKQRKHRHAPHPLEDRDAPDPLEEAGATDEVKWLFRVSERVGSSAELEVLISLWEKFSDGAKLSEAKGEVARERGVTWQAVKNPLKALRKKVEEDGDNKGTD